MFITLVLVIRNKLLVVHTPFRSRGRLFFSFRRRVDLVAVRMPGNQEPEYAENHGQEDQGVEHSKQSNKKENLK